MTSGNDLKATYNKIAKEWHAQHQADDWWVEGTNKFISFLRPGAHVLDIGCAGGWKAKYLISHGCAVTGVDISEEMIAIAEHEVPQGTFRVMDMRQGATIAERYDGIFASASFLHIPKAEMPEVVENVSRVLVPGGYFYIAVKEMRPGEPEEEIKTEDDYGYKYQRFFSYFTKDEIMNAMGDAGLRIVYLGVADSGKTNWVEVIGQKPN